MGEIGNPVRKREYVPMPETVPVHEPDIEPASEPAEAPAEAPERELVPA